MQINWNFNIVFLIVFCKKLSIVKALFELIFFKSNFINQRNASITYLGILFDSNRTVKLLVVPLVIFNLQNYILILIYTVFFSSPHDLLVLYYYA